MDTGIEIGHSDNHYENVKGVIDVILRSDNSDDVKKAALGIVGITCKVENVSITGSSVVGDSPTKTVNIYTEDQD